MKNLDLTALLRGNPYPGRGIVLGSSPDGEKSVIAYFIMGRSENSRNRVFVETPDGIRTQAFDPSKMTDPSLIIYAPVRVFGTSTIVTNGDQTDTIREGLAAGKTFAQALHTRTFEPDAPNYTPRISGLVKKNGDYTLSILKSADGDPAGISSPMRPPAPGRAISSTPTWATAPPCPPLWGNRSRWKSPAAPPRSLPICCGTASTRRTRSLSLCATSTGKPEIGRL